jgi:phosphoribosyl 1,2-cyclic phosphodiesterase
MPLLFEIELNDDFGGGQPVTLPCILPALEDENPVNCQNSVMAKEESFRLQLRFWGVRGSYAATGEKFAGHGGNTACLEIRSRPDEVAIFDGGSGIRRLGQTLLRQGTAKQAPGGGISVPVFLTHFHWDHIQGIPYFTPLYDERNEFTFYSFRDPVEARAILGEQMATPYFPIDFDAVPSGLNFARVRSEPVDFGARVSAFPMNHPQGAVGYRIEHQGASIVYASDLEHGDAELDKVLRKNAEGADVLIYDAQYTPAEYESKRGWGHSTWLEATRVARDAGVKRLLLIHHDPEHDDEDLQRIVDAARGEFEATEAAREELCIRL